MDLTNLDIRAADRERVSVFQKSTDLKFALYFRDFEFDLEIALLNFKGSLLDAIAIGDSVFFLQLVQKFILPFKLFAGLRSKRKLATFVEQLDCQFSRVG